MQNNYKGNHDFIEGRRGSLFDYLILTPLKYWGCILGEQETQYITIKIALINKIIFQTRHDKKVLTR